jgi:hypothetical protein
MKDALGKDLVIGQVYGYSRSDNGITTVKIGKLVKINQKMVSLEVQESKRAIFTHDLKESGYTHKIINVKANGLFPVYPDVKVVSSWEDVVHRDSTVNLDFLKTIFPNGLIIVSKTK